MVIYKYCKALQEYREKTSRAERSETAQIQHAWIISSTTHQRTPNQQSSNFKSNQYHRTSSIPKPQ